MKKKLIVIVVAIMLFALAIGGKFLLDVENFKNEMATLKINEISLADVPDGTYQGAYDANLIKVVVMVDVKNHIISNIELIQHDNGKGGPGEAVIPEVIKTQSLEVDAVSGATNSSKVILKTIELAINSAD